MGKIISNKRGASLIEVVATIAIVGIALTMIYNVLDFNIKYNAINQEKSINVNIANAALNYIQNSDFQTLRENMDLSSDGYLIIDSRECNRIYSYDQTICNSTLAPIINNKNYDYNNLTVYLLPYNDNVRLQTLKMNPPVIFPEVLNDHIYKIDTSDTGNKVNSNAIRIVVIVKSNINPKHHILLEGVIIREIN